MKVAVLGAGMVGRTIAEDLSKAFEVTSFDRNPDSLDILRKRSHGITLQAVDFDDQTDYTALLRPFGLVITAVPGFMGYKILEAVIRAGKNVVDISFSPEDTLQLNALARQHEVTAIVDCGVAPGMGNFILGRYNQLIQVKNFECYVGGLPKERRKPFEYKAPFSPVDVIEEYTRPARLKENGIVITRPALSEIELMDFEEIGTLEAFNTDGLRSILHTMGHIPNLKEKTLRYPGHADLISGLQRSGFFDREPISISGAFISPLDFSTAILVKEWQLQPLEEEFTIMKVIVEGELNNNPVRIDYNLLDRYDTTTKTTSMARTTGYTCAGAAHLIARNLFTGKGVFPPELVGAEQQCFDFILNYLTERNVHWRKKQLDWMTAV